MGDRRVSNRQYFNRQWDKREKVRLSLVWHLGEQKGEINTYKLSTHVSHFLCFAFISVRKFKGVGVKSKRNTCDNVYQGMRYRSPRPEETHKMVPKSAEYYKCILCGQNFYYFSTICISAIKPFRRIFFCVDFILTL